MVPGALSRSARSHATFIQSLVDSVAAQYRDAQVGFVHLPEKVESPLVVRLRSETLQKSFRVFVNPYTGQILGALGNQPWLLDRVNVRHRIDHVVESCSLKEVFARNFKRRSSKAPLGR